MIGGLDDRPKIGSFVRHDKLGNGTIVKLHSKNKVAVLFHGSEQAKLCQLSTLKTVSYMCMYVILCGSKTLV